MVEVVGYNPNSVPPGGPAFTTADLRALTSRPVTVAITSGSTTVTLTSGTPLTSADVGAAICGVGVGVPSGATISSVVNSTTALISLPAATTNNNLSVTISQVVSGQFNAVTVDANGNIVAAGQTVGASGTPEGLVARLTPTGSIDSSFNTVGYVKTFAVAGADEAVFNSVAVVPAGPSDAGVIMVGGASQIGLNPSQLTVAAFKPGGTPYLAFASGALQSPLGTTATGITIVTTGTTAGNVVAVGPAPSPSGPPVLLQFKPNGTQSGEAFVQPAPGTSDQLNAVAYDPFSGFLSVAGTATQTSTPPPPPAQTWVVGQYNATPTSGQLAPNPNFGSNGLAQGAFGKQPGVSRRGGHPAGRQDGGRR